MKRDEKTSVSKKMFRDPPNPPGELAQNVSFLCGKEMEAPDKDMARKTEVMESKKCRRHSKIEERGTHSIDRMVERNTSERDSVLERFDMDHNKQDLFFTSVGRIHREVRHGYTNNEVYSSKWNGVHPRRFSSWRWKAQIEEFKEYKDGMSADVTKNAGWLAAAQDRKRWKRKKKQSFPRGLGKNTLKHRAQITRKSESVPKPPSVQVFEERSAQSQG